MLSGSFIIILQFLTMVCNFGLGVGIFGLRGTIHYKNFNKLIQKNYLAVVSAAFLTNIKIAQKQNNFFSARTMYKFITVRNI